MENPTLIIPEILGFILGVVVTFFAWIFYFILENIDKRKIEIHTLQRNLKKVNAIWSFNQGHWLKLDQYNEEQEKKQRFLTRVLLITLLPLMSWPGFIFSLVLMLSFKYLPSKNEKQVFATQLTRDPDLSESEVTLILQELSKS
ncbi:MAG: hypothetical protein ACXWRE_07460 [Pseudobdellovibrionaceae bacterium]